MSLGGLLSGLLGKVLGGEKEKKVTTSATTPGRITPKKSKAGKLALIKTSRAGVFNDDSPTAGRGKLFGN